jgi:two-component system cell cycle sensor histidine kinase/response regulator CckA
LDSTTLVDGFSETGNHRKRNELSMGDVLHVLQVEDSNSDATLILRVLTKAGYDVQSQRVEDPEEMREALSRGSWDVIISDHCMANFDAPAALCVLHESGHDIPFIVVSGSIGEELAAALMKSGAHDYILKDHLARLAPVVEREIREARSRCFRRQVEKDLSESQQRLAQAIEATQLGTFDFSPQTGSMIWSELTNRHFGLRLNAEVTYDTFLRGLHPDDRDRIHNTVQSLLLPHSDGQFAAEYRTLGIEDRVERWVCSWGRVFFDSERQPVRFVGVTQDVSERKRLEAQLHQAQKLESVARLAGGVAHDFNNLLTVINGYSEMLLQKLPRSNPLHDLCKEIRTAGERASALSGQLLVLSRKQVVQTKVVNLNVVVAEVERMLGRVIGADIHLESILSPSLGCALADSGQLHQVLMNLALNARDAMPLGGTLTIETANVDIGESFAEPHVELKPGHYVELKVSDTGVGISKEVMAHLFEPFFTTKRVGQGTGLGLATAYGIIKQNGGSISVHSELDLGTSVNVYLPRIASAESPQETLMPAPSKARGKETILVVDDQEQLRKMVVRVLRSRGYKVLQAANAADALIRAEGYAAPIHLLLTDVVMPGMSGSQLAEKMKALRPAMQIIFMSGYSASGYSEHASLDRKILDSGVYLAKPFSPDALLLKVRGLLARRAAAAATVVTDSSDPP